MIYCGDCREILRSLDSAQAQVCITSPPYWGLRTYSLPPFVWGGDAECEHQWGAPLPPDRSRGTFRRNKVIAIGTAEARRMLNDASRGRFCLHCGAWLGSLGLEPTPELYVEHLVEVLRLVRRVLCPDGVLWLNIGDSFCGRSLAARHPGASESGRSTLKVKDLCLIPARVALALQADGWWIRSDIVWHKPNPMPESVRDRPARAHEYVLLCSASKRYFYDKKGDIEQSRSRHSVWSVATRPSTGAHFAVFPETLVEPMILVSSREGDIVLDPFCGSGTVCAVAKRLRRRWIGIDANPEYCQMAISRIAAADEQMTFEL